VKIHVMRRWGAGSPSPAATRLS